MTGELTNVVVEVMPRFEGYVYPNEATLQPLWSILIVLYPYITGLVAGAFIMASLVRVFNVRALEPVYRMSLLTAFSFLLCCCDGDDRPPLGAQPRRQRSCCGSGNNSRSSSFDLQ